MYSLVESEADSEAVCQPELYQGVEWGLTAAGDIDIQLCPSNTYTREGKRVHGEGLFSFLCRYHPLIFFLSTYASVAKKTFFFIINI